MSNLLIGLGDDFNEAWEKLPDPSDKVNVILETELHGVLIENIVIYNAVGENDAFIPILNNTAGYIVVLVEE